MKATHLSALLVLGLTSCGAETPSNPESPALTSPVDSSGMGGDRLERDPGTMIEHPADGGEVRLERADKFAFTADTRISVEAQFDAGIAAELRLGGDSERPYTNRVSDACVRALRSAGRPASIVAAPGQIEDDGSNVLVRLTIEPNTNGSPYRVSLVASQQDALWRATIERPSFRYVPGNVPIRPDGTTPDGRPYWDAARDTDVLAGRLCSHLLNGETNASEG